MTRHAIWKKDDFFEPALQLTRLELDAEDIEIRDGLDMPLVYNYNWEGKILGKVTDVRLEDGDITGELTWFPDSDMDDEMMKELNLRVVGFYAGVIKKKNRITSCRLAGVAVCPRLNIPGEK